MLMPWVTFYEHAGSLGSWQVSGTGWYVLVAVLGIAVAGFVQLRAESWDAAAKEAKVIVGLAAFGCLYSLYVIVDAIRVGSVQLPEFPGIRAGLKVGPGALLGLAGSIVGVVSQVPFLHRADAQDR
jgi:hypothetical protein